MSAKANPSIISVARRMTVDGLCFSCQRPVKGGVAHADLGIRSHDGVCADSIDAERRVYDRSPRGRWRPRGEVLARVAAKWKTDGAE